jgi:hypothetical protein
MAMQTEPWIADLVGPLSKEMLDVVTTLVASGVQVIDARGLVGYSTLLADAIEAGLSAPGTSPRIGLVARFGFWALCRHTMPKTPTSEVRMFHEADLLAGDVQTWVAHGTAPRPHSTSVLALLLSQWDPSCGPAMLRAAAEQIRAGEAPARELVTLAQIAYRVDLSSEAEALAREVLALVDHDDEAATATARVDALGVLGSILSDENDHAAAEAVLEQAVELAEEQLDRHAVAITLLTFGLAVLRAKNWSRAEPCFRRAATLVDPARDPEDAAAIHHNLATALLYQGRFEEAEKVATMALSLRAEPDGRRAQHDRTLIAQAVRRAIPRH